MYMSPVTMGPSHIGPPERVSVVWSASGPKQWCWYLPGLLLRTKFPGTLCQGVWVKVKPSFAALSTCLPEYGPFLVLTTTLKV